MKPLLIFEFTTTDPVTLETTTTTAKLLQVNNQTRNLVFENVDNPYIRFEIDFDTFNTNYLQNSKARIL